jgi:hypothetical protein
MLELMGSKNRLQKNFGGSKGTAAHKFTVFQIQPPCFYTFGNRYLFWSKK